MSIVPEDFAVLHHDEAEKSWHDAAHRIASRGYAFLLELLRQMAAAEAPPATLWKAVSETQPSTPAANDKEEPSCDTNTLIS